MSDNQQQRWNKSHPDPTPTPDDWKKMSKRDKGKWRAEKKSKV